MTKVGNCLCVFPLDRTTRSLERIANSLIQNEYINTHVFKIRPNIHAHNECLELIRGMEEDTLIVFLGHGRSDFLYGSVPDENNAFVSSDFLAENQDFTFEKGRFIYDENVNVFEKKKIISVACNSGKPKGIGQIAIEKGAKVYLGFGEVPTSAEEFEHRMGIKNVPKQIIDRFKGEINFILKLSLNEGIKSNMTFSELQNHIRLVTDKRAYSIVKNNSGLRNRRLLANTLHVFRKQMRVHGDGNLRIM